MVLGLDAMTNWQHRTRDGRYEIREMKRANDNEGAAGDTFQLNDRIPGYR